MASADTLWRRAYDDARAALPESLRDLQITFDQFAAHAEKADVSDASPPAQLAEFLLVCACAAGDAQAIAELERHYLLPSRASLARFSTDHDFIDDVLQELRTKLLVGPEARILNFSARGPLGAWIRVAASRVAIDMLRAAAGPAANAVPQPETLATIDLGPEVQLLREVYRDAFRTALAGAIAGLDPQDRTLLRRHIVEQLTLQEIALPQGVHAATIARRLALLREQIAEAVRGRLADQHRGQGGATSLESLARAIRSEIDISLAPMLIERTRPPVAQGPVPGTPPQKTGER